MNAQSAVPVQSEVLSPVDAVTPSWRMNQQTLLITSLSFALILLSIVWLLARRKSQSKGTSLLLLGASDAGKTAILTTLVYKQTLSTQTSMQINSSIIPITGTHKTLRVIDVPGHPRVRHQFRQHMKDAKAIAFVVDAGNVSRNGAAVAEHLHTILHAISTLPPSQPTPPIVILAHKADLLKAPASAAANNAQLAINRVRTVLERELDKRRASHAGGVGIESLGDAGKGEDNGELVGEAGLECSGGGEFKFENWEGGDVNFIGTSVKVGEKVAEESEKADTDGLEPFREWLLETA